MIRPCFLVIDREHSGSISTRKLVIETAKFNVITAYSSAEAIETLKKYPNVNGIVLDSAMHDMACGELVAELKRLQPATPIVVIDAPGGRDCGPADHHLESFDPAKLLLLLKKLEPRKAAEIEAHDAELSKE